MKRNDTNANLILAETVENGFDNVVLEVAETALEEIIKAFPITNAVKGIYNCVISYQENQRSFKFIQFVEECELHKPGQIFKIFKDKSNIEMGGEILNALEKSYLPKHSQMIARASILYDSKQLDRRKFLKYSHIIPKLTSYLLTQISTSYHLHLERKNNEDYRIFNNDLDGAGQELASYGFLQTIQTMGSGDFYKGNEELEYFYQHIYNNKYGKD
ncbi:hypothetical protein [Acinetobacter pecorum]|uniref:Uncharacterized protein n=1 Tax=Acinetobacter pecorum TaxID=2762215 RepID=A0ABR8VZR0_9GAMM|nr:hypothetical protein [Acinetobacter pecorum]MBD8010252.1 hypothetical protein [Acinetobacter pecorum]